VVYVTVQNLVRIAKIASFFLPMTFEYYVKHLNALNEFFYHDIIVAPCLSVSHTGTDIVLKRPNR